MNNKIKYIVLSISVISIGAVSGYLFCPYFKNNKSEKVNHQQKKTIVNKTTVMKSNYLMEHKSQDVKTFSLKSINDYNYFNYTNDYSNSLKPTRNIFIVANVFESSFININEMLPYTKAIIHVVPIFNESNNNLMKILYCNESNNAGKNIYYYIKYKTPYKFNNNCSFDHVLERNQELKAKYNLTELPMVIFDSGDKTTLKISESEAQNKNNVFNKFLLISSPIKAESMQKSYIKRNSGENISIIKPTLNLKKESSESSVLKDQNIMKTLESGFNTQSKITKTIIKNKQIMPVKKYITIGESYPNLYRVSVATKTNILKLKQLNGIKNESEVKTNTKIYY